MNAVSNDTIDISTVWDKLDKKRQSVILQILFDMLRAQQEENDFDFLSPEDVDDILEARRESERGETTRFNSVEDAAAHFGFAL
ncbi:hypothetical protein FACS1894202_06080 [Clostridia bacterium]|nr:hypothetical protein FACS1894202_06080 [Clostridia bacterium]